MAEEQETPEAPETPPEVLEKAQKMGWIPPDKFKGDPKNFVSAEKYVERANELMPIMKGQLSRYEEKIGRYESEIMGLKSSLESNKKTTERLVKMSEKISEKAYEQAKKDITKQQAQAVSDGDVEKWQQLEDQKDKLERPEPVPQEPEQPQQSPVFSQWHAQNDWYLKDSDLTIYANGYAQTVQQQNPGMPYDQVLKTVESQVKKVFSSKFENENRETPPAVDTGSIRETPPVSTKKTYNSLPADAKQACDNCVAQGLMTKEEYVKEYFSEE